MLLNGYLDQIKKRKGRKTPSRTGVRSVSFSITQKKWVVLLFSVFIQEFDINFIFATGI